MSAQKAWCIGLIVVALLLLAFGQFARIDEEVHLQSLKEFSRNIETVEYMMLKESNEETQVAQSIDITIATQASADRAWLLSFICDRWPGEIVAAILTGDIDEDAATTISHIASEAGCASPRDVVLNTRRSLEIFPGRSQEHGILLETAKLQQGRLVVRQFRRGKNATGSAYPINALRNMAFAAVTTSHLLMLDIDFVPSIQLYEALNAHRDELIAEPRLALVVPAFQRKGDKALKGLNKSAWQSKLLNSGHSASRDLLAPATLSALTSCLARANCIVFDSTWNPSGHSTTDSMKWLLDSSKEFHSTLSAAVSSLSWSGPLGRDPPSILKNSMISAPLRPIPCFNSNRFEPYLVVSKAYAPKFNPAFFGYGKNKIEFVTHLRYLGFRFAVLPIGFVIHLPHPVSKDKSSWLHLSRGKHESDRLYKAAIEHFHMQIKQGSFDYQSQNRTWLCDASSRQRSEDPPSSSSQSTKRNLLRRSKQTDEKDISSSEGNKSAERR